MDNKTLVRAFVDASNKRTFNLFDNLCSPDMTWHFGTSGEIKGLAEFKRMNTDNGGAVSFPDYQTTIVDLVAEGDKIAVRYTMTATNSGPFMGKPASGKKVSWAGLAIYRSSNGKLAEVWAIDDSMGLALQLGVISMHKK